MIHQIFKKINISLVLIVSFSALLLLPSCSTSLDLSMQSPDGNTILIQADDEQNPSFILIYQNDTLFHCSEIGLQLDTIDFSRNISMQRISKCEYDETWSSVNTKQSIIRNHYNEYHFSIKSSIHGLAPYQLVFRLYEDGFAYRYDFMEEEGLENIRIIKENSKIRFYHDFDYRSYLPERHNLGPCKRSESQHEKLLCPLVISLNDNKFMAIHEAGIFDFAPFTINTMQEEYSIGIDITESKIEKAKQTSWRSFLLGQSIGDIVESNLLVNLNEPCKIENTSWIRPGKSMWDWRVWGYKAEDGFEYGLNTVSHKRFIDFASENNIQYLLLDADWYGAEFSADSDPTSAREGIDIEECMQYAKSRDVGIILYLNDVGAKEYGLERVLKQFHDWGAVGVKYGFMRGSKAQKVKQTRRIVELCAEYELMVNFHDDPIPPSGDRRTWPNLVSREFGHAQADALRSHDPETSVNTVLINMIAGPLDLTNGWFDLNHSLSRVKVFEEIPGTIVGEVAKLVSMYAGWTVLPDSPEEYLKRKDLFECIRNMPSQFDSLIVLDASLDEYVCIARKSAGDWFVGSLCNEKGREIEIAFDFLSDHCSYQAIFYEDAEDSHYTDNKENYTIRTEIIDHSSKQKIRMAPGGGHVIHLKALLE